MLTSWILSAVALPLLSVPAVAAPASDVVARAAWPDTPFNVDGRDMVGASGAKILFAGINWSGHGEAMIPEGLQYNSVEQVVSKVKSLGMNVIRLTFAIEMVDDIFNNSPNQGLRATFVNALGSDNGTKVFDQVIANNPSFTDTTTRLEVYDAIAAECARQQIWVHLDNHMSKAKWCCSMTDGNAWFGDLEFNVFNWHRGLGYMANHVKSWTALGSLALRNELRSPESEGNNADPYDWVNWHKNSVPAMDIVNGNNSNTLIFLSGLNYDTDITALVNGQDLGGGTYFDPKTFSYTSKIMFEMHNYQNSGTSCGSISSGLYNNGYGAMNLDDPKFPNHAPVVMTEFGFDQSTADTVYAQCIKEFVTTKQPGGPGGWTQWVLSGSYYIREGIQDYEETWGLTNHDWSGWRNQDVIDNYVKPFVSATLS